MIRFFILFGLLLSLICFGQSPISNQNRHEKLKVELSLPKELTAFYLKEVEPYYEINTQLNPFYLTGDFNNDHEIDFALAIIDRVSKKKGVIIYHPSAKKSYVLGANTRPLSYSTIWESVEVWKAVGEKLRGSFPNGRLRAPGILLFKPGLTCTQLFWYRDGYQMMSLGRDINEFEMDGKLGVVDIEGDTIIPPLYDGIAIRGDYIEAAKDGKQGLLSRKNETLIPFSYDFLVVDSYGKEVYVRENKKYGIVSTDGEVTVPIIYDELVDMHADGLYTFFRDKHWGWRTLQKELASPRYSSVTTFYPKNTAPVFLVEDSKGYDLRDKNDSISLLPKGLKIINGSSDLVLVKGDSGVGIMNNKRQLMVKPIYDHVEPSFNGPYWFAEKDGKHGLVDASTGKVVIPLMYDGGGGHFGDCFQFKIQDPHKKKGNYGVVDLNNKIIIPFKYDHIYWETGDFIVVEKDKKYGAVDRNGRTLLKIKYDYLGVEEGVVAQRYQLNGKYGFVYEDGRLMTDPVFDDIRIFYTYYSSITLKRNGELICLTKEGKIVEGECKE